jgi:acetyl esterase/lipase
MHHPSRAARAAQLIVLPLLATAQGLRERVRHAREASRTTRAVAVPDGARAVRDIAYGADPAQRCDLYLPARAAAAPLLLYVHGGGWANGDKTNPGLAAKLDHWLPKGQAVASCNYRLVPAATPLQQADDIAHALATLQRGAGRWGLDPERTVLMGHSAGAHLVALLGADPRLLSAAGAAPPRGVVALDSGALDVPALMAGPRVPAIYRQAFGSDPAGWRAASPWQRLGRGGLPMLLVCSSERRFPTSPCDEARKLAARAGAVGVPATVRPEALDHGAINRTLGEASAYTRAVSDWIDALLRGRAPASAPAAARW